MKDVVVSENNFEAHSSTGAVDSTTPALGQLLKNATRRLILLRAVTHLSWGFGASAVVAFVVVVLHRLLSPATSLESILVGVLAAGPILSLLVLLLRSRSKPLQMALELEQRVDIRQRFSSLLALRNEPLQAQVREALIRDSEKHAQGVDVRRALPYRRPRPLIPSLVVMLFLLGTYLFLPSFDLLGQQEQREELAKTEKRKKDREDRLRERTVRKIEQLRKEAEKRKTPEETQRVLSKLQERLEKDNRENVKPQTRREALVQMQQVSKELRERREREEMKRVDNMLKQMRSGQPNETELGRKIDMAMKRGDISEAAKDMQKLAEKLKKGLEDGSLKPEEAAQIQRDIGKMLGKMGMDSLSKQIQESMKDAAKDGKISQSDLAKMSESLSQAQQQMDELDRLVRERELLDKALDEIEFTQDELAQLPSEWPEDPQECPT